MNLTWIELLLAVLVAITSSVFEKERREPLPIWSMITYGEIEDRVQEVSDNLCYVPEEISIFNNVLVGNVNIYEAARACTKSHPYTMIKLDGKARYPSFVIYDKEEDSFTHYDPLNDQEGGNREQIDNILTKTFRNYKGTKDETLLTMPQRVPIRMLTPKMQEKQKEIELEEEQRLLQEEMELLEKQGLLYPEVPGAKLYHEYDNFTRRQRIDIINATRYVGKLMSQKETRRALNYLTWQDPKIARCLRFEWTSECDDEMQSQLKNIDTIFTNAPKLNEDLLLFRGLKTFIPLDDQSYTFTTPNKQFAESFTRTWKDVDKYLLKLTIPRGTPILSYGLLSTHDIDEIILPRGGKFEIQSIHDDEEGYLLAEVTYVYNPEPRHISEYAPSITSAIIEMLGGGRRRR